ncbi:hypothetical protein U1Q18_007425 [Sarracenia purpurea var. burkii]
MATTSPLHHWSWINESQHFQDPSSSSFTFKRVMRVFAVITVVGLESGSDRAMTVVAMNSAAISSFREQGIS